MAYDVLRDDQLSYENLSDEELQARYDQAVDCLSVEEAFRLYYPYPEIQSCERNMSVAYEMKKELRARGVHL
jgi:hypothetical protein